MKVDKRGFFSFERYKALRLIFSTTTALKISAKNLQIVEGSKNNCIYISLVRIYFWKELKEAQHGIC